MTGLPKKDWKEQKCGQCEYFVKPKPDLMALNAPPPPANQGVCRRNPPKTDIMYAVVQTEEGIVPQVLNIQTRYPLIEITNNACGEWKEAKSVISTGRG